MKDDLEEFRIPKRLKEKLTDIEFIKNEIASGKNGQEILGFSNEAMARLYGAAYSLFERKQYEDSLNSFLFLVTLNSYQHEYWLGLGMATQMVGKYEEAIDAYEMAAILNVTSPVPYFYLAKCLFAIHDRESAFQALSLALEYADDIPEYQDLKAQAMKAKDILLNDT